MTVTFTPKQFDRFRRSALHNGVARGTIRCYDGPMCFLGHAYNGKKGRKPEANADTRIVRKALGDYTTNSWAISDRFVRIIRRAEGPPSARILTTTVDIEKWIDHLRNEGVFEVSE
ncbi:MAG: hypothetical protein V3U14_13025 [candidate division NC10 bacterium]